MIDLLQIVQQEDFEGIFEAMEGKPVTVRLIDPPLHEFLPSHDRTARGSDGICASRATIPKNCTRREALLQAVEAMRESNPMLGLRGFRL